MKIVCFDPGKSASWARYDTHTPHLMQMGDVNSTGVGRLSRPCAIHIRDLISDADLVLVEEVAPMGPEGVVSSFTFGMAFGTILSAVQGAEKPLRMVTPKQWSAVLKIKPGVPKAEKKAASIAYCLELWPGHADLTLKKHHNRADAALMIYWYMKHGDGRLIPTTANSDKST